MKDLRWFWLSGSFITLAAGCTDPISPIDPTGAATTTTDDPSTSGVDSNTDTQQGTTTDPASSSSSDGGSTAAVDGTTAAESSSTGDPNTTGVVPVCGNNVIEGNEACDLLEINGETCESLGFEGGELGCNVTCDDYNILGCYVCGNGTVDIVEDCEVVVPEGVTCESMGFEGGELVCGNDCFYDTSDCSICGDGIQQGDESCDGFDLAGEDCASLGLVGGMLTCAASCSFDPGACDIPGVPFGSDIGYTGYVLAPPVLPCEDISATGTASNLTDDDAVQVPIGFNFPFYGVNYMDVTLQSNGAISFGGNTEMGLNNSCLPTNSSPSSNILYLFWDDLNPTVGAGEVRYEALGVAGSQRFVVQFDVANFSGDAADLMRFQVVLNEGSGIIEVCYPDTINAANAANSGAEATSGIQADSANALQFSCNTPDLVDGTQLLYIPI
ncbi:MAG: hypothetical protein K0V04_37735 [Deltaproteobacteria bacterium]|nr:hypothetical protein [Deltaproteobacteria bacterium]